MPESKDREPRRARSPTNPTRQEVFAMYHSTKREDDDLDFKNYGLKIVAKGRGKANDP